MREFVAWEAAHGAERDAERDAELADLADVGDELEFYCRYMDMVSTVKDKRGAFSAPLGYPFT